MDPSSVLARVVDLVHTWKEDSPYAKSINLVMQKPVLKIDNSYRNNQSTLKDVKANPKCNLRNGNSLRYLSNDINDAYIVNSRSKHIHQEILQKEAYTKRISQSNYLRKSTKSLIDDLMDKTLPPSTIADEYAAFDQSNMYNPESKHVYECFDVSDVNSNIIKSFKPN